MKAIRGKKRSASNQSSLHTMNHLPRDILIKIFLHFEYISDLCIASEVCREWYQASLTSILWKKVMVWDIITRKREQDETRYKIVDSNTKAPYIPITSAIKRRRVSAKRLYGTRLVIDVISRRSNTSLLSLDLSHCFPNHKRPEYRMNDADLQKLAESCPNLKEFRVSPSSALTGEGFVQFASKVPHLILLHINECNTLMSRHLRKIVTHCPQLEDISTRGCSNVRSNYFNEILQTVSKTLRCLDLSLTQVTRLNLQNIIFQTPKLEEIHADNCYELSLNGNAPSLNNIRDSLFPSLKILSLDGTMRAPAAWIIPIVRTSHKLESLSLSHMRSWSGGDITVLNGYLPPLKHLSLAGRNLRMESWPLIFKGLRRSLVQCDISENQAITGELEEGEGEYFEALEELNLTGTSVTEESTRKIVSLAPRLSFIDLTKCRSIYNREFRRHPLRLCNKAE